MLKHNVPVSATALPALPVLPRVVSSSEVESGIPAGRVEPLDTPALFAPAQADHLDERVAGPARQAWNRFFELCGESTEDVVKRLEQSSATIQRDVQAHGITYNVYADADGPRRPWALDTLPVLITPKDWAAIESGVQQRAKLLNAMQSDVYGNQALLHDGLIPSALVHGHPGYLRGLRGIRPAANAWLHVAAFDLARSPEGQWSVVSQRTQAPSGLGYVLENRLILARQFPEAFRDLMVRRLALPYRFMMDGIAASSPKLEAGETLRCVLLTPGPYNETHFEHAYLARFLGIPLVEGGDLVVRGERVFLRTLSGLVRVHAVLKRLDDEYLDPLELRSDSALGVPGLLQAIRAGQVLVANLPGSGWLESPALLGFLPRIAERLLNEPLELPALDTWWCGEQAAMVDALPRLSQLVIKPTWPNGRPSEIGRRLSRRALDELTGRIVRHPPDFTVQRFLPLSQTPSFEPATADSRATVQARSHLLRVFAVFSGVRDGQPQWEVVPGGLARMASPTQTDIVSMQYGGSSADVWVMGEQRAQGPRITDQFVHAASGPVVAGQTLITSRAAENLFWFGRYTERCEHSARLALLSLQALNSEALPSEGLSAWLVDVGQRSGVLPANVPSPRDCASDFAQGLVDGLPQTSASYSVGFNLNALRQNADAVRERLSAEQWRQIQRTQARFALAFQGSASASTSMMALETLIEDLAAITGAQVDRMTRDNGWRALSIGRQLERVTQLSTALACALEHTSHQPRDGFDAVLQLFDSSITYRSRYSMRRDLHSLTELLLKDPDNPRSLAWVTSQLRGRLNKLAGAAPGETCALAKSVPEPILAPAAQNSSDLQAWLESLTESMLALSDALSAQHFRHLQTLRAYAATR